MTFGDDFNTKIFRIFVAFMIRYKLYAENQQRIGELMDPQVERFLKLESATLRSKYRAHVRLLDVDLQNGVTAQAVVRSIIPFTVDAEHDQTICDLGIQNCGLTDDSVSMIIESFFTNEQRSLLCLDLSGNHLTK